MEPCTFTNGTNPAITVNIAASASADAIVKAVNEQAGAAGVTASVSYGPAGKTFKFDGTKAFTVGGTALADVGTPGNIVATAATGNSFQVGANNSANDRITVTIDSMSTTGLGISTAIGVLDDAGAALDEIDTAIAAVSDQRSELGAKQNRFESTINNLQVSTENIIASESRIRDTDMASEMTNFTKQQILQQAGTAMLGQANSLPQSVLRLLG